MPVLLDADRLLTFVTEAHDRARSVTVQAVYFGLEQRITRGDFDAHDIAVDLTTTTAPVERGHAHPGPHPTPTREVGLMHIIHDHTDTRNA